MADSYDHNALKPGFRLREWIVEGVLGAGGFAIVYKGTGVYFSEAVAIKEYFPTDLAVRLQDTSIAPSSKSNEDVFRYGLEKFIQEAQILWSLSRPHRHPNLLGVRGLFEENGTAYMVMDFEEGRPLSQLLREGKTFDEQSLWAIMAPVIDGLNKAHKAGILHRDIKPANILIHDDGRPVLIDFGAARSEASQLTSKMAVYTPGYAAVEQQLASESHGAWTDIYALAATMYQCMTGSMPPSSVERGMARTDPLVWPATLAGFSDPFIRFVSAGLAVRAGDRPQSLEAWLALRSGDAGQQIPASSPEKADSADAIPTWRKPLFKYAALGVAVSIGSLVAVIGFDLPSKSIIGAGLTPATVLRQSTDALAQAEEKYRAAKRTRASLGDLERMHAMVFGIMEDRKLAESLATSLQLPGSRALSDIHDRTGRRLADMDKVLAAAPVRDLVDTEMPISPHQRYLQHNHPSILMAVTDVSKMSPEYQQYHKNSLGLIMTSIRMQRIMDVSKRALFPEAAKTKIEGELKTFNARWQGWNKTRRQNLDDLGSLAAASAEVLAAQLRTVDSAENTIKAEANFLKRQNMALTFPPSRTTRQFEREFQLMMQLMYETQLLSITAKNSNMPEYLLDDVTDDADWAFNRLAYCWQELGKAEKSEADMKKLLHRETERIYEQREKIRLKLRQGGVSVPD
jgi:serine/threonine protein kinase